MSNSSISPTSSASPCLAAALLYAELGLALFPCKGKVPLTAHGFKDATTDLAQIRRWWTDSPDANIGTPTEHLGVLDIDPESGGKESDLEAEFGLLPATWRNLTGGGGLHLIFTAPPMGCPSRVAWRRGVDVRGVGGYIIIPPSVHPETGRRYAWEVCFSPDDIPLAPLPAALARLLGAPAGPKALPEGEGSPKGAAWRLLLGAIPAGQRNAGLTRIGGWLRLYHPLPVVRALLLAVNDARCRPPLEVAEVDRIAASVARYPQPGVNGHPLAVVPGFQRETSNG